MRKDSRKHIHIGINFVLAPPPIIDSQKNLEFQKSLAEAGISLGNVTYSKQKIEIMCQEPEPLQITVNVISPPIGQLLILAPQPGNSLNYFIKNVEAVVSAYEKTWPGPKQIISRDATIRMLFETTSEHAFVELWEKRLKQSGASLDAFGKPILGGGLRFVMPPQPSEPDPFAIEVKIESYLQDVKKLYVETQFSWPKSSAASSSFDAPNRLHQLDSYIEKNVVPFMEVQNGGTTH